MIKLYNTLYKKVTEFKPYNENKVKMYTCGPTVYFYSHIGNMRAYLFMDLLRRTLKYNGYEIEGVINITDVGHLTSDADEGEDKMSVASKRENKSPWEIAKFYTDFFMSQAKKLNIDMPENIVPATSVIPEIIAMIKSLIKNGYAYETSNGIYFEVDKFSQYGSLSGIKPQNRLAGARIEIDNEKRNPADFVLWVKAPKEHIMQWDSPWGKGYPGWHIECSAIGIKFLGTDIDIHTGGVDHLTIHHENEIAQNYGATLHNVVKRWMHGEFLLFDNGKMSKSLNNIYTIDDLEKKGYRAIDFRYLCFNTHYRKAVNFTFEILNSSHTSLTRLYEYALSHKNGTEKIDAEIINKYKQEFLDAINNDLNVPVALSVVWNLVKTTPKSVDVYNLLLDFDKVLGLNISDAENDEEIKKTISLIEDIIPGDVTILAQKRWLAKQNKQWQESDMLRKQIADLGYQVIDSKDSYQIKKL